MEKKIMFYKCLECGNTSIQRDDEIMIIPNCGCSLRGMTPVTITITV